jgi:hypothetical protein
LPSALETVLKDDESGNASDMEGAARQWVFLGVDFGENELAHKLLGSLLEDGRE